MSPGGRSYSFVTFAHILRHRHKLRYFIIRYLDSTARFVHRSENGNSAASLTWIGVFLWVEQSCTSWHEQSACESPIRTLWKLKDELEQTSSSFQRAGSRSPNPHRTKVATSNGELCGLRRVRRIRTLHLSSWGIGASSPLVRVLVD